jgi:glucose/mannose-6-phosphate isomerase
VLDSLGMLDAALSQPETVAAAYLRVAGVGNGATGEVHNVLLTGMGPGGEAADAVAALCGPKVSVPLVVLKDRACPGFVGPGTLVIALSYRGDTPETVEAASEALEAGARVVAVGAGGELAEVGAGSGGVVALDGSLPAARSAVGAMTVAALGVLELAGLVGAVAEQVERAVEQLRARRDELSADRNSASDLARTVGRTLPLVYGGGSIGGAAAWGWKTRLNDNPKVAAFANQLPELAHNEVCGWAQHGDVTRQVFSLVLLRHDHEDAEVARRMEQVAEVYEEIVAGVHTVLAMGQGPLAQLLDLLFVGEIVTLHMAAAEGVDPGPTPSLEDLFSVSGD